MPKATKLIGGRISPGKAMVLWGQRDLSTFSVPHSPEILTPQKAVLVGNVGLSCLKWKMDWDREKKQLDKGVCERVLGCKGRGNHSGTSTEVWPEILFQKVTGGAQQDITSILLYRERLQ